MKETDKLLKTIADGLKLMAKGIESVADQVNSLTKTETRAKPKTAAKTPAKAPAAKPAKKPVKKPVKKPTKKFASQPAAKANKATPATQQVLAAIKSAKGPVSSRAIATKTGLDTKKVTNAVYRLKKQGRVKSVDRGKYAAV